MTVMKQLKRALVTVAGSAVLAAGVAMLVLPGPAFLMIPGGLAILALEFAWARRWLRSARAVLPRPSELPALRKKMTRESVARSLRFLLRQVRRTLWPNGPKTGRNRLASPCPT